MLTTQTFVYKSINDLDLKLDVQMPPTPGTYPVLFWIHGGGCVQGRRQAAAPHIRSAVAQGKVLLVSPDYRLAPQARLPTILEDVGDAFLWAVRSLPEKLKEVKLDVSRVVVSGSSVGGYLAAWLGLGKTPPVPLGSPALRSIQALALIYPITTFNSRFWSEPRDPYGGHLPFTIAQDPKWEYLLDPSEPAVSNTDAGEWESLPVALKEGKGKGGDPLRNWMYSYAQQFGGAKGLDRLNFSLEQFAQGALEEFDVPAWVTAQHEKIQQNVGPKGPVKLFIVHGDADKAVDVQQGRDLAKVAKYLGLEVTYQEVPGKDHQFDEEPDAPADVMEQYWSFVTKALSS